MTYRVFIVEDDPHTRKHLVDRVNEHPELEVTAEVGDYASAMAAVQFLKSADVALVDLGLPDGDGVDIIRYVSQLKDPASVLVISVFGDERHVVRAIEAGAQGYLLKDTDGVDVGESILQVLSGDSPINPSIARHLLKRFRPDTEDSHADDRPSVTPREHEVLKLIARGFSNPEIAKLLGLSQYTVTSHIKNLYRKLAVNSRGEAVFEAVQLGLVEMKPDRS